MHDALVHVLHHGTRMRSFLFASALVSLLVTGCASDEPSSPEESQLWSALETWSVHGPASYDFTWQQSCECTAEWTRPIRVSVQNGQIVNAVDLETQVPVSAERRAALKTIDGVFDTIQDAIDDGAHSIVVEYEPNAGVPVSIGIDYSTAIADEELALQLRDFRSTVQRTAHDLLSCGGSGG